MKVRADHAAGPEEWDRCFERCPHATYFHGREWAELWRRASGGRIEPAARQLTFSDGTRVIVPFSRIRGRFATIRVVAGPEGTYGGWLYDPDAPPGARHVAALADYLRRRSVTFRENPFDPIFRRHGDRMPWTRQDFTQCLRLDRDFAAVRHTLRSNQVYRKMRQAERAGLELRRDHAPQALRRYHEIYLACRQRWGESASTSYSRSLFESMPLESPGLDFWTVRKDGQTVAAGPFFKAGRHHVVSWLTLADPAVLGDRPYDFIYARLIEHYHRQGFAWFDFNPSGGHEGVVRFKDNFGPERRRSRVFRRTGGWERVAARLHALSGRLLPWT